MITSFHFRGELYTHKKHNLSLKCLYQARRVRVNVYVCKWYPVCLNVSMRFQNCSNSVVFLFFCQILELFQQCCIFCFSVRFQNCSNSVVFLFFCQILELFQQCCIFVFLIDFGTVPTVLYFLLFISLLKQERGYLCIIFRRGISILSLCL